MQAKKILTIDDDGNIRRMIEHTFTEAGAEVFSASNGPDGLRLLYKHKPDLIILDIMMPEMDGWQVCRQIRQLTDVPVILLTALKSDEEIIQGLEVGADDFISKPFNPKVLLARARAVLRRVEQEPEKVGLQGYQDHHLNIDLEEYKVIVAGQAIKLTTTEYRLLGYLVQNAGRLRTFDQILENVWGYEYRDSPDYVHVYVSQLRRKIEPDPKNPIYIETERGAGYRFVRQG